MRDDVIVVLETAHSLITKGWSQYAPARDERDRPIPLSSLAAKVSLFSGIELAVAKLADIDTIDEIKVQGMAARAVHQTLRLRGDRKYCTLTDWQNQANRTKWDVLRLLEDTIDRLQGSETIEEG